MIQDTEWRLRDRPNELGSSLGSFQQQGTDSQTGPEMHLMSHRDEYSGFKLCKNTYFVQLGEVLSFSLCFFSVVPYFHWVWS